MTINSNKIIAEHKSFLKSGGLFRPEKGFLKISGGERVDFLHRLTSQDIKNLESGMGARSALLEPSAVILAYFDIYNCGQFFLIVVDKAYLRICHDTLEKFHFAEDVAIEDVSEEFEFLSIQGLSIAGMTKVSLGKIPKRENEVVGLEECMIVQHSDFSRKNIGFHLFIKKEFKDAILSSLEKQHFKILSLELWNLLRTESGQFLYGIDVDSKNIILESGFADYVARDKGCYPGQEVVERVFTYGNIAKKLMGLRWPQDKDFKFDGASRIKLFGENEDAGYITSVSKIPWSNQLLGFGMIRRPFYEPGKKLKVENSGIFVEVSQLPNSFDIRKPPAK